MARAAPLLIVFIWSSGYLVARGAAPHAEPFTFLTVRFAATTAVLTLLALVARASWPTRLSQWRDIVIAGVLLQGLFLAGVFWSVRNGLPAGLAALLSSLQPLLTALLAGPFLGERVPGRAWLGLFFGLLGAGMVLAPRLGLTGADLAAVSPLAALVCFGSTVSITLGALWQKKTGQTGDLRVNAAIQFMAAFVLVAPLALLTENLEFDGAPQLWISLTWSVLGSSVGGILLMLWLLRRTTVTALTALFYLVPAVSAALAWLLFREELTMLQMAGMLIAVVGVALAARPARAAA